MTSESDPPFKDLSDRPDLKELLAEPIRPGTRLYKKRRSPSNAHRVRS